MSRPTRVHSLKMVLDKPTIQVVVFNLEHLVNVEIILDFACIGPWFLCHWYSASNQVDQSKIAWNVCGSNY
jgi:hypothetical protein